ncbi:MAG: RluA family pseudouridine synthase [Deltaproteobacteria bacterium]|nr:RluA family pseudouridine synthase [Deltaproteobacteria bacterium]
MQTLATSDNEAATHEYRRLGGPVPVESVGQRVDDYLARQFPFLSRNGWQQRISSERLLVNGRRCKNAARLKCGDELTLYAPKTVEPEVDRAIRVLWQDGPVMAVYKPGNLPMHENGPYRKNTFTEIVWQEIGREWAAVHRLDRETSGIVICGATAAVRGKLATDFAERQLRKEYLAIARGLPRFDHWVADGAIGDLAASAIRIKKWVVPDGLHALTEFSVLGRGQDASLLEARPKTGRTNQIRIHAAHAGHELFGDKTYHPDENVFLEYFERGLTENVVARTGWRRLCLHARSLEFVHPVSGREVRVEVPMPDDMVELWAQLSR